MRWNKDREGRISDHPHWDALVAYNPAMSWVTVYGVAALTFMMAMYCRLRGRFHKGLRKRAQISAQAKCRKAWR
jgi:hypothetical protein